jgi:predicted transglutaminase-like cysteine proteinase
LKVIYKYSQNFCFLISGFLIVSASIQATIAAASQIAPAFHIRQERTSSQQVLVSRPNPQDLLIASFLRFNNIASLEDYARWLKNNMLFQSQEQDDLWPKPEDILKRKSGDCEDYAILTSSVVQVLGYEPQIMAFIRPGGAHAVCAFKVDGYYVWLDNDEVKMTNARTLNEFSQHIAAHYKYNQVMEFDLVNKKWELVYRQKA